MGILKLVPPDGLRAENTSSSSKLGTVSSSTYSSSATSTNHQTQDQTQLQDLHQSCQDACLQTSFSPQPFFATLEPIDITPEERVQNILCQKVVMLAAELFPEAGSSDDLQVEYVGEGSFHQVIGFAVPQAKVANCDPEDEGRLVTDLEKYVVRIPRDATDMLREVAVLKGLEGRLNVPVPRVIAFDASKDNVLGLQYTLETRLRGRSLEDLVGDDSFNGQSECVLQQVVQLVEGLTEITAPYPGSISEEFNDVMEKGLCSSRIPIKPFDFPFDASSLISLPNQTPLTYMLALIDLWLDYEQEYYPNENNFVPWNKIKAILHSLQRRDLLGEKFHLSHGDLAPRNIMAEVVNESSVEITGVVDWDFACFAPKFCAYRAPLNLWDKDEAEAIAICTADLVDAFKDTASAEWIKYAFSTEAKIGRKIWDIIRLGMLGKDRRWYALNTIWDWQRLHPKDNMGSF
ncbi:hypothetical protein EKO04_002529 [Ascochyta lentis]|uniref:Aminoglycoside phosphotransferase domain-containing protein n=1 Tax=Ascochyta lentis TaxID=205686 RepID=A0A8H7MG51_9PLEO|nr:hypothetical protein EKO04_002529 [Ascochyta lentis]